MSDEVYRKRLFLRQENRKFNGDMIEVNRESWASSYPRAHAPERVFRSRFFLAQIFKECDGAIRLSINRTDIDAAGNWKSDISWDALWKIKAQCGFPHSWAVEIFPPVDNLVNVANMRHLFILPQAPAFAWKKGR